MKKLKEISRSLTFRAGAYGVGAIISTLVSVLLADYVSEDLAELLGGDAVDRILTIVASSMLVVVTFSLSTIIAAYSIATSAAPARATSLIVDDRNAQTALSTFLGAFIFSLVSLVALSTKYYGPKGRVILFFITLIVLCGVIWTIIRWIGHLSHLGRLENVIEEVEAAALKSIQWQSHSFAWQWPAEKTAPDEFISIKANETGFLQSMDLKALSELVEGEKFELFIEASVGQFVYSEFILGKIVGPQQVSDEVIKKIRTCFLFGRGRTFEDDPRFGFIVLSEIGSRALSPGVNDPGTAIQIIGILTDLISKLHFICIEKSERSWSTRLHIRSVSAQELVDDAFRAISRDGAANAEVSIFLQKAFRAINFYPEFQEAAKHYARQSLERSRAVMTNRDDLARVEAASILSDDVGRLS